MNENKLPTREEFLRGIRKILDDVRDLAEKDSIADENSAWTDAILSGMDDFAKECGLLFYASGSDREYSGGEWLYDAVFWHDSNNERELFACAEITWDSKDSQYPDGEYEEHWDYQKVLVARTRIPIFITEAGHGRSAEKEINDRLDFAGQFPYQLKPVIFVLDEGREWCCSERLEQRQ